MFNRLAACPRQRSRRIVTKGLCHEIFGKTVPTIMRDLACGKITDLCISVRGLTVSVRITDAKFTIIR